MLSVGCRGLRDFWTEPEEFVHQESRMAEFLAIFTAANVNDEAWNLEHAWTCSAEALHDFPSEWPGVVERLVVGLRSEQNVVDSE